MKRDGSEEEEALVETGGRRRNRGVKEADEASRKKGESKKWVVHRTQMGLDHA